MLKRKLSTLILAATITNLVATPITAFAETLTTKNIGQTVIEIGKVVISKFNLYGNSKLSNYNEVYKVDNSNIISITNNGGRYANSTIDKAIDENFSTHWETGKENSTSFTNEVIVSFNEVETLNRIVYAARQESAKGKGFAQEVEIYASLTDSEDDFTLVGYGSYSGSTGDIVEIKFANTEFKRVKFVFKKANQGWASAAEFMFYKEDAVSDKMNRLFTDNTLSVVSEEFNSSEKINTLDEEVKNHPLYEDFKENIENAKLIIENNAVNYTEAKVSTFLDINSELLPLYDEQYKVPLDKITSITTNGSHYGSSNIEKAIDGDFNTSWHSGRTNNDSFTNEVIITLDEITELNRVVYTSARGTNRGFAEAFDIYGSTTSKGDTFELVSSGTASRTQDSLEIKFNPTEFKRIKFVFKKGYENWAIAAEFGLYKEDTLSYEINKVFKDGTQVELSDKYNSLEAIDLLEKEVENHPFRETYIKVVEEAKDLLENPNKHENASIYTCEQRGDSIAEARQHKIARPTYTLYSYGKYISPGETIKVYADADENGVLPKICLGEIGTGNDGWAQFIELKPGLNLITAPSVEEKDPRAIYIYNGATPEQQAYAPRIRIEGGTSYPVYRHGESDPVEFVKELEEYCQKVSTNLSDFSEGINKDVVYNMAEITSEKNTIATSAKGALQGLKEIAQQGLTVYDTMEQFDAIWDAFQYFSGFSEDAEDPSNQIFNQKFNTRILSGGSYGWAGHGYVGFNGGGEVNRDNGYFKMIVKPPTDNETYQWGYIHEWGHELNNGSTENVEITNNLYNWYVSKKIGHKMDWCSWDDMFTKFSGEEISMNYWNSLGVLAQPLIYFGDDLYGKASQVARTNPDGVLDGLAGNAQRMAVTYSISSGYNLVDYFDYWGYARATDLMKEKVAHLPKPDVKLEYLHGGAEDYKGNGFNENLNVEVKSTINEEAESITLSFKVDDENKADLLGYEILKDGEVIGYTRKNSFTVEGVDTNTNARYEVVPYAKDLTTGDEISVNSFTPYISLQQDSILVGLNDEFNAEDLAKGYNYKGEEINSNLTIESNVNTNKKGSYEIKYTLVDNDIEVSKTINVQVVSKYEYLSDSEWESVQTQWGNPRRNSNIKGRVNREIKTFEKGFGIHANGKIVYDLSEYNYDTFEALLGVDMTIVSQNNSSLSFEIIGDGKTLAKTDVIKHADNMALVSVPVTGVQKLEVIIKDGGNGNTSDHAVIVNPKLSNNNVKPLINTEEETIIKFNSDFDIMEGVTATDVEDGDITKNIEVDLGGFKIDKPGRYNIEYSIKDSDNNISKKVRKVFVYSSSEYVSDIDWASARTDWSTVKKDKASGGATIKVKVDGEEKIFDKGIGTHANSEIVYNLEDTNYEYFESYVGVDRNIQGAGRSSVIFKIYADGEEVYNSGLMKWEDDAKFVRVSLDGVSELKLVVNDAGNGNASDHANFADIKFLITNSKPQVEVASAKVSTKVGMSIDLTAEYTAIDAEDGDLTSKVVVTDNVNFNKPGTYIQEFTVTDSDGNTTSKTREISVVDMNDYTYLSDINWKSGNAGSALRKDVSTGNTKMRLLDENGEVAYYDKGIGTHSYSTIIYDLSEYNYDYFSSFIGIDRQMINRESSVEFQVYLDGVKAYDSGLVQANDIQKFIELNITGVKELKLVVTDYDGSRGADWANWADTKLHYAEEGIEIDKAELDALIENINGLNSESYTEESFTNLQTVLEEVNTSLADGYNQEEVDTLTTKLNQAFESLVLIEVVDYDTLTVKVEEAKNVKEYLYTVDSYAKLKEVLLKAEVILEERNSTKAEVEAISNEINSDIENLEVVGRKDKLNEIMEYADTLKDISIVGAEKHKEARWNNFLYGREAIREILLNVNTASEEVEGAIFQLQYFIDELEIK